MTVFEDLRDLIFHDIFPISQSRNCIASYGHNNVFIIYYTFRLLIIVLIKGANNY